MQYEFILKTANQIKAKLAPYCERIEIAGSVRREVTECKDIELVAVPDKYRLEQYLIEMKHKNLFIFYKNGAKYKQFKYSGVTIDLFLAENNNFGWIYFIRTGSKAWNIRAIKALEKKGIVSEGGYLRNKSTKEKIITPLEQNIFDLLGCKFWEANRRSLGQ